MNSLIFDSNLLIKPSNDLLLLVKQFKKRNEILPNNKPEKITDLNVLTTDDFIFISSLEEKLTDENNFTYSQAPETFLSENTKHVSLYLQELIDIYKNLEDERVQGKNIYLHEVLQNCTIYLPENKKVERNPTLEKRCILLRNKQDTLKYRLLTRNVNPNLYEPKESIAQQLKQINKELIAVGQLIISVLAGFLFGFIGIELLTGQLDTGIKLLLGIACALIIALAELYFLSKQITS